MMKEQRQRVYQELAHLKLDDAKRNLSNLDWNADPCYFRAAQALLYALDEKYKLAKSTLEKINEDDCDPISIARMDEAKLFLDIRYNRPSNKKILLMAQEILALDPDSAFAKSALAKNYFLEKKTEEGKRLFFEILTTFPEAKWVYKQLVRHFFASKKYSEALQYVPEITPKLSQVIYRFLGITFLPHPYLSAFVYMLLFVISLGLPSFLIIYSVLAAINILIMLHGWRVKDALILGMFRVMFMEHVFLLIIYFVVTLLNRLT